MNKFLNIFLAIVALICLMLAVYPFDSANENQALTKTTDMPEYIGEKMTTTIFDPTGKKRYVATSNKVRYFNSDGRSEFDDPVVYLFEASNNKQPIRSWQLSANNAKLSKQNILLLIGNVSIKSLFSESKLQQLDTQSAMVDLTSQDVTSDSEVMVKGLNFTTEGRKLNGNLRQQIATLTEQVKTYYEINNK